MLSPAAVESLLKPINESLPSGEDMEYDPAYTSLEADSQIKAEQQFGDTVIAAVEPEWRDLLGRSTELLGKTKDLRVAILCLRAATRTQGIIGLEQGLSLIHQLLEQFWDTIHPKLDADDNNDPTMRLNSLAALTDPQLGLRDLHDCLLGSSRGVGPLKVRDIAIANGKLAASATDPNYTSAQVEGALRDIHSDNPAAIQASIEAAQWLDKLQNLLNDKTSVGSVDLKPLRTLLGQTRDACQNLLGEGQAAQLAGDDGSGFAGGGDGEGAVRGEIRTREQALMMMDKIMAFLERTEPGNPAPLLIARAKRLIGVDFLTIMQDMAPDAMSTIQNITGRPPE
jgi:type VI secretion system protein ImpA